MGKIIKPLGDIDQTYSKQDIVDLADSHAQEIIEKDYDLLKVYVELKRYQVYLGTIADTIKANTLEKAIAQGDKTFEYSNAKVTVQNRTTYNFENDIKWVDLDQQFQQIKELKKKREEQLKKIKGLSAEILDTETGEIEQVMAPQKEMVQQLMIKL